MPRPKLPSLKGTHGAPMGRPVWPRVSWVYPNLDLAQTQHFKAKAYCFQCPLRDGYDEGGAYWGSPSNLWCATNGFDDDDNNFQLFTRAVNRADAMKQFEEMAPNLITWFKGKHNQ